MLGFSKRALAFGVLCAGLALPGCHEDDPIAPTDTAGDVDGDDSGGGGDATDTDDAGDGDVPGAGDSDDAGGDDATDGEPEASLTCEVRLLAGNTPFGPPTTFALDDTDEPAEYAASPGFQLDFSAFTTSVPNGSAVRLTVDGTRADTLTLTTQLDGSGQLVFANVTMPKNATVGIEITVGADIIRCEPTSFIIDSEKCSVELLPVGGCLTEDASADAGTQASFVVKNTDGRCDEGQIIYRFGAGGVETTIPAIPLVSGEVTFTIEVDPGEADGIPLEVKAAVASGASVLRRNETDWVAYQVDAKAPEITIDTLTDGSVFVPSQDEDGDISNGLQIPVTGTVSGVAELGATVTLGDTATGQTVTATITGATAPFAWKGVLEFPSAVADTTLQAIATDACGNASTAFVADVDVLFGLPPGVTIISPTDGSVLAPADDGDESTPLLYETDFSIAVVGAPIGATILVECRGSDAAGPYSPVGSVVVTAPDQALTIPVVLSAEVETAAVCRVVLDGTDPGTAPSVSLTVALPAPRFIVVTPAPDTTTSSTQVHVTASAEYLDGFTGTLTVTGSAGLVYEMTTIAVAADILDFDAFLTATGDALGTDIPDGTYTLTFAFQNALGFSACATVGAICEVSITLDRAAPTLTISQPSKDTLTPPADADSDDIAPGYQADVTVDVADAGNEAGIEVCLAVAAVEVACQTVASGATSVLFADITLQPGANDLSASASDAAGNQATPATRTITLVSDGPAVLVDTPAQDTTVVSSALLMVAQVNNAAGDPLDTAVVLQVALDGLAFAPVVSTPLGNGRHQFNVTLPALGTYPIVIQANVAGGPAGFSAPRTVTFKNGPALAVTAPADGSILNLASAACSALPGDCVVDVQCTGTDLDDDSAATLNIDCGGTATTASADVQAGVATFTGVTLANNAVCALSCSAIDTGTGLLVQSPATSVRVDRTAPVLGPFVTPNVDTLTSADDGSAAAGFQYVVSIDAGGLEAGQIVTLTATWSTGGDVRTTTIVAAIPDGGIATLAFPSLDLPDDVITLDVTASDSAGNPFSATRIVRVDTVPGPAILSFTSPVPGATLLANADGDALTTNVYETTFTIGVSQGTVGATVTIGCRNAGTVEALITVGSATVVGDGPLSVNVAIPVDTSTSKECEVSDDAAKPAIPVSATFVVALPAPSFVVSTPAENFSTSAASVDVTAVATNLDGRIATLTVTNGAAVVYSRPTAAVAAGALLETVLLTADGTAGGAALANGNYTISFTISDAPGNDACATTGSDCSVTVRLDVAGPSLTITAPAANTLTPPGDADASITIPGYQTTVTVTVDEGGNEAGTQVCLTVNAGAVGCQTVAIGATTVTFTDVTLQPGDNTLDATGTDSAGNTGDAPQRTIVLVSDAPQVAVLVPAADTSTLTAINTVTLEVRDNQGVLATSGVVGRILINGVASPATGTALGNGQYQFTITLSAFGNNEIIGGAIINGGIEGFSAIRNILFKQNNPAVVVTTPANGSVVSLASPFCAVGTADCDATVTCTATDTDEGSAASVTATCGIGAPQTVTGTVTGGIADLAGVILTDLSTCTLICSVTDAGTGFVATSPVATVTIDRTAPIIANFIKPANNSLIFVDDSSNDPGFQYVVQGRVGGVEAGQVVTLEAVTTTGTITRTATVSPSVPDGQLQIITFAEMDLPQGLVTFTITVSDLAGNAGIPMVKSVQVVSELPLIRLSTPPTYVAPNPCTQDSQCPGPGACLETGTGKFCALGWNSTSNTSFFVRTVNIPALTPNQFRICSDNPIYAANADCTASGAGFNVVQTFDVNLPDSTVNIAASLIDGTHLFTAEAKLDDAGVNWVSTMTASVVSDQTRLIVVDRSAPTVSALQLPDDTIAPVGCLNIAEGDGNYDVVSGCSEAGTFRLLLDGLEITTAPAVAGQPLTLANVAIPDDQDSSLVGQCIDGAGNIANSAAVIVDVDTVAPTLTFTKPVSSPVLAGADRDVELGSDELNAFVSLVNNGSPVGQTPVGAGGIATFPHGTFNTLTDGAHQLTASVSDACGNPKTATSVPLVVDTAVPAVTIAAPADGASFADADDASPGGGYQVSLGIGTTGDAATYKVFLESNCAASFTACAGPDLILEGTVTNPGGAEPALLVTLPIVKAPDFFRISVQVSDAAGNLASDATTFTVTLSACSISVSGLPVNGQINNGNCPVPGTNCASTTIAFTASLVGLCPPTLLLLTLNVDGTDVATQPVVAGTASFSRVFTHGTQPVVIVEGPEPSDSPTTGPKTYTVDLSDPTPVFTAATVGGFATPASGAAITWNKLHDLNDATTGMQANLRIDVTDAGFGGGVFTSLSVNGTPVGASSPAFPVDITGLTFGTDVLNVTFLDGVSQVVTLVATDAAGNTASTTFSYTADTIAPGGVAVSISTLNRRRPSVTLAWNAVADDGSTGTAAAAYDVRYSLSAINDTNFETSCSAGELGPASAYPTPGAPGSTESYEVTATSVAPLPLHGPDARAPSDACKFILRADPVAAPVPWHFAVRAIDDAGNVGPVVQGALGSTATSGELALRFAKAGVARVDGQPLCTAAAPACDTDFDNRFGAIGDVNNDGFDDFSVGGNGSFGFCIHYGSPTVTADFRIPADEAAGAGTGTNWQCFLDKVAGTLNEQRAGWMARNAGDVNGDGRQDLVVPAYGNKNTPDLDPQLRIYFGTQGGQLSTVPDVIIRGYNDAEGTSTNRFGAGGDFNGDGRSDFVLGARVGNASGTFDDNRAYLVPGNNTWAKVSGASLIVDLSVAATLTDNHVQTWSMAMDGVINPTFGSNAGFVGNILTDAGNTQFDDIVVFVAYTSAKTTETKAIVIKGRPTPLEAVFTLSTLSTFTTAEDANTVVLRPDLATNRDFGTNPNVLGRDVTGDGIPDIGVTHITPTNPGNRTFYLFNGAKIRGSLGQTVRMSLPVDADNKIVPPNLPVGDNVFVGAASAGWIWVGDYELFGNIGNIADDPHASAPGGIGYRNRNDLGKVYIRVNHNDPDVSFPYGTYPWADLVFANPFGDTTFMERDVTGIGDFNGDGFEDFLIGTASGYAVLAW